MAVTIHVLVILVIDWSLASSPLTVRIGHGWVLGKNAADRPVEQIWVVHKSLGIEGVIVQHNGSIAAETAADTPNNEVADPTVGQPAPHVEVFDGKLTDNGEAEKDTKLGPCGVVRPVEVRLVGGSRDHAQIVSGEPALKHSEVVLSLCSQLKLTLFQDVLTNTEADKFTILNVFRSLGVDSSPLAIIIGVLKSSEKQTS